MVRQLCICELVPRLETRTRVLLVVHREEADKPTNTGLLAARCLTNAEVIVIGERDRPPPSLALDNADSALLFPSEDATELTRALRPLTLVVPDGTWRQARKMRTRVPGLARLPCVTLPAFEAASSTYRLRTERRAGGLATLEAVARALTILEEPHSDVEEQMLAVFRVMVDRTLWLRGALRDDAVAGGVPEAARRHDPRGGLPLR